MSTLEVGPRPRLPRDVRIANACAVAAGILVALYLFYFLLTLGPLDPPPLGLMTLWLSTIILSAAVKIVQWATDNAARRARAADSAEMQRLTSVVQELVTTLLNEGDHQARLTLVQTQELLNASNGASVSHLSRTRPGS